MKIPSELLGGQLRSMELAELSNVLVVEQAAYSSGWPRGVFEAEFSNDFSVRWVFERDGRLLGHVIFWVVHDELHLLNIAVHPAAQRQGIGVALMDAMFLYAEAHGLQYLTLEVRESNAPARALYERLGFTQMGLRKKYYQDNGENAVIMGLVPEWSSS